MRNAAIGLIGLLLVPGAQDAQNRSPLVLEIAARGYLQGGRAGSLAGDSGSDRLQSYVWADQTLCGMGAGDRVPSNTPWIGWRFEGNVVSRDTDDLVVNVSWQRMWESGRVVTNSRPETRTFRIRSGERVELDRVTASNQGTCGTLEARLEAGVTTRAAYLMGVPGGVAAGVRGGRGGGVATAGGGGRGGRGGAVGGVATAGAAGGVATGARGGVASAGVSGDPTGVTTAQGAAAAGVQGRGGVQGGRGVQGAAAAGAQGGRGGRMGVGRGAGAGSGQGSAAGVSGTGLAAGAATGVAGGTTVSRGGRGTAAGGSTTIDGQGFRTYAAAQYEAEIWLVHKRPDGAEHVQQQTVRFGAAGSPFTFPPVQVAGNGGPITIDISGSVQTLSSTGQRYGLTQGYVARGRGGIETPGVESSAPLFGISIARRARRAAPFIDTRGATDISLQTPKPEDVLSFELPALQKSTEDLLKGHTFSIRLRVTPIK